MKGFDKYGSIDNLYKNSQVLEHTVVVTEKIHGSNMRFGYFPDNGGIVVGTRNNTVYKDGVKSNGDGYNMSDWVLRNVDVELLKRFPNHVFCGEFHGSNIQKGVKYSDEKTFRCFDIKDPYGNYLDWDVVVQICNIVCLDTVPVILHGKVELADLEEIIDKNSQTAIDNGFELEENIAEGVVIKPLKMQRDRRGNWIRAKYKSQKWAENAKAPKVRKPDPDRAKTQAAAREFAEAVVTSGRVATVIEHITRDGNIELKMARTGEFLRAFIHDVMEEHKEVYKVLDKKEINIYNKIVNGQAVVLWQKHLIENR